MWNTICELISLIGSGITLYDRARQSDQQPSAPTDTTQTEPHAQQAQVRIAPQSATDISEQLIGVVDAPPHIPSHLQKIAAVIATPEPELAYDRLPAVVPNAQDALEVLRIEIIARSQPSAPTDISVTITSSVNADPVPEPPETDQIESIEATFTIDPV